MIKAICKELEEGNNIRANLITIKECIKENDCREEVLRWERASHTLQSFLRHEDAKVRKNAALILGRLPVGEALEVLYQAYETEDRLFVKSAYLTAMETMDCQSYADRLRERYGQLKELPVPDDEKKHRLEELRALERLLQRLEGKKHKFTGYKQESRVLLTTHPEYREITAEQIKKGKTALTTIGVKVQTKELREILDIRTFRELLFLTDASKSMAAEPQTIAEELYRGGLLEFLESRHDGETPYYFRIEARCIPEEKRAKFVKELAVCMEERFQRRLLNSADRYELELRLLGAKDGSVLPCVKLLTIPMRRFSYRKCAVAASMHPTLAALLMRLAEPYLKEGAQVLDPFCGVGTLLIERDLLVAAGDMYGIDTFGDAIEGARENTRAAGMHINYIHRDYFDFTHNYLFDEIVTDMPQRGKKTKEEQDALYRRFFDKAQELLRPGGVMVVYSDENAFIKKQLRIRESFSLRREYVIRSKEGSCLYIIGYKG